MPYLALYPIAVAFVVAVTCAMFAQTQTFTAYLRGRRAKALALQALAQRLAAHARQRAKDARLAYISALAIDARRWVLTEAREATHHCEGGLSLAKAGARVASWHQNKLEVATTDPCINMYAINARGALID